MNLLEGTTHDTKTEEDLLLVIELRFVYIKDREPGLQPIEIRLFFRRLRGDILMIA